AKRELFETIVAMVARQKRTGTRGNRAG
ncbi:MAG: hypothetical protein K0R89_383, partial [Ramlibacter sp.]|nr:hypothetical protein [Ramlibacter sp.]